MDALSLIDGLTSSKTSSIDLPAWKQKCYDAMNDDFNTPVLIAVLFEGVKFINLLKEGKAQVSETDLKILSETMNQFIFDVLGLESTTQLNASSDKLGGVVALLIQLRNEARANKDFATSDKIRDELANMGIQLMDGKEGTTFSII
ncbi:MAG: cysteine--tRNA ligase, partial [Bacteroidia bacterium]|nr:cysteine--tRNA ligase [Bacteroidia bacterium]